jgi:hypothetical protein
MRTLSTFAFLFASTVATLAHENCYELIGCPHRDVFNRSDLRQLSCQNLWYIRNRIYDDHGYCFTTPRAIREFDNSDCHVNNANRLDINNRERQNITRIRQVERQKGCG